MLSQMLTLFTTPVVYLYLDRLQLAARSRGETAHPRPAVSLRRLNNP